VAVLLSEHERGCSSSREYAGTGEVRVPRALSYRHNAAYALAWTTVGWFGDQEVIALCEVATASRLGFGRARGSKSSNPSWLLVARAFSAALACWGCNAAPDDPCTLMECPDGERCVEGVCVRDDIALVCVEDVTAAFIVGS
jgi:hypothetical protein